MSSSPAGGWRVSEGEDSGMLPDLVVSRLYTAVVSDILDDLGHPDHVLDPAIRPRAGGQVIAGTLRAAYDRFGVL